MNANIFVDTNVLVYRRDSEQGEKQALARAWMERLWARRSGRLSFQVLQEYYVTVTAKLSPGLDSESARSDVRSLLSWHPITVDKRVLEGAWVIQDHYQLSWWDALIVAAAQVADCRFLLTEDLQDGQELGEVRVVSPFKNSPESVIASCQGSCSFFRIQLIWALATKLGCWVEARSFAAGPESLSDHLLLLGSLA